jgi:HK97 family phage major capsid protein
MNAKDTVKSMTSTLEYIKNRCIAENRQPSDEERQIGREMTFALQELGEGDRIPGWNVNQPPPTKPFLPSGDSPRAMFGRTGDTGGFTSMGEFFSALVFDPQDHRLQRIKAEGQRTDITSEGGSFIPTDYAATFLELVTQASPVLQRARVFPMRSGTLKIPAVDDTNHSQDRAGLVATWAGEGATLSPDTIRTRQLELNAHKLTLICKATREFMSDAINADRFIRDTMVKEAAWTLDGAFIRGNGVGQPLGMMSGTNLLVTQKVPSQEADTILWENILPMYEGLNPSATMPIWLASPSAKSQIFNMFVGIGTAGINYWPSLREATPKGMELCGAPVFFSEHCEVLGDQGDILLAAPENYIVGMRQEVQVDVSPHVGFLTDEIYFRLTLRVDAQPACSTTLTLRDGSTVVSDFVTLAERA